MRFFYGNSDGQVVVMCDLVIAAWAEMLKRIQDMKMLQR